MIQLRVSEAAALAILEQADYYCEVADASLAARWEASVDEAVHSLLHLPERGTPCRFHHPALARLRWIPIPGFPRHMLFYCYNEPESSILIVQVLYGSRDVVTLLDQ